MVILVKAAICDVCNYVSHYDGHDDAIIHMRGRNSFLVHHKALRRYLAYFTTGGR